ESNPLSFRGSWFRPFGSLQMRWRRCRPQRWPRPAAPSGRLQCLFALLPVARAKLVRLQSVEDAQHFFGAAPDVEVGDVNKADDALRVNNVSGSLRHPSLRVQDAERARELALDVRQHRERQRAQLFLVLAPGKMHEFRVDADAQHLRIAVGEFLVELSERRNLGGAYESEILGPEEDH